ncbi:NtaA/DmoA family FMN-dependent monooxygenase [Azotobacter sp. CWF10]
MSRQIHLAGFLLAGPVVHSHAVWRHPDTLGDYLDPEYYARSARVLEEGLFDLLFFADRFAIGDQLGGSRELALRYGAQDATRLDPLPILSYLVGQTRRLGLGVTRSTTYYEPAHVARSLATLDHLSRGRAAWNIVTSMNDSEGRLFGKDRHLEHDLRYDRADEFVEVALKLWSSWAPGALKLDRERGILADPAEVRDVAHQGEWFKVEGPLNIPRSPQGRPLLIQAGSSGRGRRFGARWAEAIFSIHGNLPAMRAFRDDVRRQVIAQGRAADQCKVLTAVMPFIGGSEAEARASATATTPWRVRRSAWRPCPRSSTSISPPSPGYPPGSDRRTARDAAGGGREAALAGRRAEPRRTRAKLRQQRARAAAGRHRRADCRAAGGDLQRRRLRRLRDLPGYLPGSFAEFAESVVPHLQRLGLYRRAYEGATLREHLGLGPLEA